MENLNLRQSLVQVDTLFKLYLRYIPEALATAIVMIIFGHLNSIALSETLIIIAVVSLTLFILDLFAPTVGQSVRQGMGFSMGYNLVGGGNHNQRGGTCGYEHQYSTEQSGGMDDQDAIRYYSNDRVPPNLPFRSGELQKREQRQENLNSECVDLEDYYVGKIRNQTVSEVRPYETESTL